MDRRRLGHLQFARLGRGRGRQRARRSFVGRRHGPARQRGIRGRTARADRRMAAGGPQDVCRRVRMAGARQGWIEVPYNDAPCAPSAVNATRAPKTRDPRLDVRIIAGVRQNDPAPDVMRGEETQVAGILQQNPAFDGVICMPGTHTKWVRVSKGQIVRFQTCMTGEIFALIVDAVGASLQPRWHRLGPRRIRACDSVRLQEP